MSARNSRRSKVLAAGILIPLLTVPAGAAAAMTGKASATILQVLIVTETAPMSFAEVAPPPGGGTIVLTPSGDLRSPGGFVFHGTPSPAAFHAHGVPNYPASVSISTGNVVTGPGAAMRLHAFTTDAPASFDGAANLKFAVGAALTVNPSQMPGEYNGTFAVTVNY